MNANRRRIIIALCIIALMTAVRVFGLDAFLTVEAFRLYRGWLLAVTAEHYVPVAVLFTVVYIVVTALSIPGAAILSLAAGFLFGFVGIIYVNIGASGGAFFAFLIARYLVGDWLQKRYSGRLESFNKEMAENGYNYLLTLRFIPLFPFFLVNILAGLTRVPLVTFAWTTVVGILPGSFVYIYTGRQLGIIEKPGDILSWPMILAFVLLGLLVLSPVLIRKVMKKKIPAPAEVRAKD